MTPYVPTTNHPLNKYKKRTATTFFGQQQQMWGAVPRFANNNSKVVLHCTMGPQSQNQKGAVETMRKIGTKSKHRVRKEWRLNAEEFQGYGGTLIFNPKIHCQSCRAKNLRLKENKHGHHHLCHLRRKKNIVSNNTANTEMVTAYFATREKNNNTLYIPGRDITDYSKEDSIRHKQVFFQPGGSKEIYQPPDPSMNSTNIKFTNVARVKSVKTVDDSNPTPVVTAKMPSQIREELDAAIAECECDSEKYSWVKKCQFSRAMALSIYNICLDFQHHKPTNTASALPETALFHQARKTFLEYFKPGTCTFTFLPEFSTNVTRPPSPHYHSLVGESFIYLDWKLIAPQEKLLCYSCKSCGVKDVDCELTNLKTNFSHAKSLFPVWSASGRPIPAVLMKYKCKRCNTTYRANDGRLLTLLPSHIRDIYPVTPRYATPGGTFHLSCDLSVDLEENMMTYANADVVSKRLYKKMNASYVRKVSSYLSQPATQNFLSEEDFTNGLFPPSGETLRNLYDEVVRVPLSDYGFSEFSRFTREIQSVEISELDLAAIDWTFQVVKNYILPGGKAACLMNKSSTKEIATYAIVSSVAVSQISHLLTQSILKRKKFKPFGLYADTTPNNKTYWKRLFGEDLLVLLGLFHLMQRVTDTLDTKCLLYWRAMVALRACFYSYFDEDFSLLINALKNGQFSQNGERLNDEDLRRLRESKRWKQRYDSYLRKLILEAPTVIHNLANWVAKYKDKVDAQGRSLFNKKTEEVIREQCGKVQYASDPKDFEMYQRIPPSRNSTHQLSTYQSMRPESALEKNNEFLAHYANVGMRPTLADALTIGGIANHNVKKRHKYKRNQRLLAGEDWEADIPLHFADEPKYWNHSQLKALNDSAARKGLSKVFLDVDYLNDKDNGEKFGSEYFVGQEKRNQTCGWNEETSLCNCSECAPFLSKSHTSNSQKLPPIHAKPAEPPLPRIVEDVATPPLPRIVEDVVHQESQILPFPDFASEFNAQVPNDVCSKLAPYYCKSYRKHLDRKNRGESVIGRPKHDKKCPITRQRSLAKKKKK